MFSCRATCYPLRPSPRRPHDQADAQQAPAHALPRSHPEGCQAAQAAAAGADSAAAADAGATAGGAPRGRGAAGSTGRRGGSAGKRRSAAAMPACLPAGSAWRQQPTQQPGCPAARRGGGAAAGGRGSGSSVWRAVAVAQGARAGGLAARKVREGGDQWCLCGSRQVLASKGPACPWRRLTAHNPPSVPLPTPQAAGVGPAVRDCQVWRRLPPGAAGHAGAVRFAALLAGGVHRGALYWDEQPHPLLAGLLETRLTPCAAAA